jgi:hypothetical protein
MELTQEQMAAVQAQVPVIGLLMAFYRRFGDEALQVSKEFGSQLGKQFGENIKRSANVTGTDTKAVAAVLNAFLKQATGVPVGVPDFAKIEGNEAVFVNEGFCPVMEAVKAVGAPHDKICPNFSWWLFEGIACAVNPRAKQETRESRALGGKRCIHTIIVP